MAENWLGTIFDCIGNSGGGADADITSAATNAPCRKDTIDSGCVDQMFDPVWLFLSLIPGGAGFVLFVYGRKQQRWPQLAGGLALMVYPYFTPSLVPLVGVGALIGAATWWGVRHT